MGGFFCLWGWVGRGGGGGAGGGGPGAGKGETGTESGTAGEAETETEGEAEQKRWQRGDSGVAARGGSRWSTGRLDLEGMDGGGGGEKRERRTRERVGGWSWGSSGVRGSTGSLAGVVEAGLLVSCVPRIHATLGETRAPLSGHAL